MDDDSFSLINMLPVSPKSIETHLQIADDTPFSPTSVPPSPVANNPISYPSNPQPPCLRLSSSMDLELDNILEDQHLFDRNAHKAVTFYLGSPREIVYTVSNNVDERALRRPGKLFPIDIRQSVTAQEILECSETLKLAAAKAVVTPTTPIADGYGSGSEAAQFMMSPLSSDPPSDLDTESMKSGYTLSDKFLSMMSRLETSKLIELYLEQDWSMNDPVHFDKVAVTASNQKTVLMSSKGLTSGIHEWTIEVLRADVDLQEIGVIGTSDIDRIPVSDFGAMDTMDFQSRALYGSGLASDMLFYGSMNADNTTRCLRDLRSFFRSGWTVGSMITVKLNLEQFKIKFLIDGKAVRYTMSLEPNKEYFPIISFSGNCQYARHY